MRFRFCGDLDCPDWVLAEINTLSKMSSVRLKVLVGQIVGYCLVGEMNYEKILKIAADNTDGISDIKGAVAAIHFIITSAAKYDTDDKALIQEIQQLGLPKENSDTVAKQYRENKDFLREKLKEDSLRVSKLVSVNWRVDQVLAHSSAVSSSPSNDPINEKLVHLQLTTDSRPGKAQSSAIKDVAFELSPERLDLLIQELSQAQKLMQDLDS